MEVMGTKRGDGGKGHWEVACLGAGVSGPRAREG